MAQQPEGHTLQPTALVHEADLKLLGDEWKDRFLACVETWDAESSQVSQKNADRLKVELANLKAKIDRINNAFADGALEVQEFKNSRTLSSSKRLD
jgi:hypothetical protein